MAAFEVLIGLFRVLKPQFFAIFRGKIEMGAKFTEFLRTTVTLLSLLTKKRLLHKTPFQIIHKFRDEEMEHHDIGKDQDGESVCQSLLL